MQYRIRNGDQLIATTNDKHFHWTGLQPNTTVHLSVAAFNGLRESQRAMIVTKTRGIQVIIPTSLPIGSVITLFYQEYSLGSVALGSEPTGLGGSDKMVVPAKVINVNGNQSTIEITNSFNMMSNNHIMQKQIDGTFVASEGYKSLYYKAGDD
ncbi:MAG: baseplate upper protein immunoglobulin like domain [Bacteriophage sp.]|nr:MAG: baseplate upper protein immunoglobulin like domain [Bacteriophage sp.]